MFRYSIKVEFTLLPSRLIYISIDLDLPAPCKVFPKAPKIALTIDDIPQQQSSEFIRRKSSGSSVNSNTSTIEPHIYEFQESEKHAESSLVLRYVHAIEFYLHILGCYKFSEYGEAQSSDYMQYILCVHVQCIIRNCSLSCH